MDVEARVVKYGKSMNSPKAYRRELYIEVQPDLLSEAILILKNTMLSWEFDTPGLEPWYKYVPCKYCSIRTRYEHGKFVKGEWVWNRRFCMRHYLIEHLYEISSYGELIESNRYVELFVSNQKITLNTMTTNYDYSIAIDREKAIVNVLYKGRSYTFKYNNHLNALPFSSSYLTLINAIKYIVDNLVEFLDQIKARMEDKKCTAYNVFINNKLVVPTCSD